MKNFGPHIKPIQLSQLYEYFECVMVCFRVTVRVPLQIGYQMMN